jgi:hypothetical protein
MRTYDAVIGGAGHNDLTCAAYLCMAGLHVRVLGETAYVIRRGPPRRVLSRVQQFRCGLMRLVYCTRTTASSDWMGEGWQIVERRAQNFYPHWMDNNLQGDELERAIARSRALRTRLKRLY